MAEIGLTSLFVEKDNLFGTAGGLDMSIRESERRLKERARKLSRSHETVREQLAAFQEKLQHSQEITVQELSRYEVEELHFLSDKKEGSSAEILQENPCRKLMEEYIRERRPFFPAAIVVPEEAEEPAVEEAVTKPAEETIDETVFAVEEAASAEEIPEDAAEEEFSLDRERLEEYYSKVYGFARDRECFYELPEGQALQAEEEHVPQDTVSLETEELEPLDKVIAQAEEEAERAQEEAVPAFAEIPESNEAEELDQTVQRPLSFIKKLEEASLRLREEEETDISLM